MIRSRLLNICKKLEENQLDGLIVSYPANISYLTDSRSRDAYLIISRKKQPVYLTDFRYVEEAKQSLRGFSIEKINGSVFKLIADCCRDLGLKRVGFEERHLAFAEHQKIRQELYYMIELIPTHELIEDLRQIKQAEEIKKIRKAVSITSKALEFIRQQICPGKKELEIAAELERFIRLNGAYSSSFEIIVASGVNSSFPHHLTSERKIRNNEPVLIDIGVDFSGYKSDLTRVFFLGKIKSSAAEIYRIVLQAQKKAILKIKPLVKASEIDRSARQYIADQGYGKFFGHSLGHGVGLEVHEAPHISAKGNDLLQAGQIFTVEPAVYLPGKFGIRLEDMCLVTEKGVEVISGTLNK